MRWYVGSDHGAVDLREQLVEQLRAHGHEVRAVVGPKDAATSCDYPDVAVEICGQVLADPGSLGLLLCGSGQGMAMAANRIRGIRAAMVGDVFSAHMAREHNDANVLCLGQRVVGSGLAGDLLQAFAAASFEGGRHARRVGKIEAIGAAPGTEPDPDPDPGTATDRS